MITRYVEFYLGKKLIKGNFSIFKINEYYITLILKGILTMIPQFDVIKVEEEKEEWENQKNYLN
jgi:hypothetical protein